MFLYRIATVLENPGKSWRKNWGKNFPGPGKSLSLAHVP